MIMDDQQKGKLMDEKVMFNLSYGLFVLTAKNGEKDNGCIVNTVIIGIVAISHSCGKLSCFALANSSTINRESHDGCRVDKDIDALRLGTFMAISEPVSYGYLYSMIADSSINRHSPVTILGGGNNSSINRP